MHDREEVSGRPADGREIEVYNGDKSPYGFFWARTVGAAPALRGEKKPDESRVEEARRRIIDFFTRHFDRDTPW